MQEINNQTHVVEFDLNKAIKCIEAYSHSTAVNSFIINEHGETVYETGNSTGFCNFCRLAQSAVVNREICSNAHLYGSYQAERFGGKYVFFCPMGLVLWASPIMVNSMFAGAVLSGPVLMVEPDEFLLDEIIRKNNVNENSVNDLMGSINEISVIQPDVVDSLSEMLFMVSCHISNLQSTQFVDDRDNIEMQSDIAGYLHYIKTMGSSEDKLPAYPLEKERELMSLISLGDKAGSQKILNEILGFIFFKTGGDLEVIKARILELVVLLSRAALEGGADVEQIFGLNYKYLCQVHDFTTIEDLTDWLAQIMTRFTDCVFNLAHVKHTDVIYKAVNYVKQNYMYKVTLDEVATHIYLSPSYFSKVFKDEMKCNFNTYLNRVRIDMSKKLLLTDTIPLVEVSNCVGYEDQSYFTKVFKKITGVSPGKYRESRGQIKCS